MDQAVRSGKPGERAVVVGAGIVGLATALYLQRDGWSVTLLDPSPPAEAGASRGNAGLIATHIVRPLAMPGMIWQVPRMLMDPSGPLAIRWRYLPRLAPWLVRLLWASRASAVERIAAALADLLRGAFAAYRPLLESADAEALVRREGVLVVYRSERDLAAAGPELALVRRHGVAAEVIGDNALRDLVPALARSYRHGVLYPETGYTLDPLLLARALAADLTRRGGRIVACRALGFDTADGRVRAVRTDAGTEPADVTVIAAGVWSRALCRALGSRVPLDTERGYHVMLPTPGVEVARPFILSDLKFTVTPMASGLRLAGTVEFGGLEAPPDPRRHAVMLARAGEVLPGLRAGGATTWMGFRPSLPDSLPVIGPSPRWPNALFAFGHGHLGLTAAAATGRAIADVAAGRPPPFDLAPFRIARSA